jgi:YVTN family beta-propeller protein
MKKFFLISLTALFAACSSDNDGGTPGNYAEGILVLNEGGFGTVTFISDDLQTVNQDIYASVNGSTAEVGQFVQSMFFDGDRAFIISSGSNKITVVNRYTFEHISVITGLSTPRYGVVYNGKAYVTNQMDFLDPEDDYVAVIDLETLTVESTIPVGEHSEKILEANGLLYLLSGAYNGTDKISVVNPSTSQVQQTLTVGDGPNSFEVAGNTLYVMCAGWGQPGELFKVDLTTSDISPIPMASSITDARNLDIEGNHLYFSAGAKVYKVSLDATWVTDAPLFTANSTSAYIGYGFAVKGNRVYISEAKEDFTSDGKLFVHSTDGAFIDDFTVGLGPNGIYFN